mmetsp:Transcript_151924/g.487594  ORF Transcript_151924/g.487594 Transcript_151924/m.487594 type:complete len:219 (-) Transcript_151924:3956-4612(-)
MAISFTHRWYSCSMSNKVSFVMPAANLSIPRSKWQGFKPESGMPSRKARSVAGDTAAASPSPSPSPAPQSLAKSSAGFRVWPTACFRRALWRASSASRVTCLRALPRAKICFLHLLSKAPVLTLSLTSWPRTSPSGPFPAFLTSSISSLILASALSMCSAHALKALSASSMASRGLSVSAPLEVTNAWAAEHAFSVRSSASPTDLFASSNTLSASCCS